MSTPVRLVLFVAALTAVFRLAAGVDRLAGPVGPAVAEDQMDDHGTGAEDPHGEDAVRTAEFAVEVSS